MMNIITRDTSKKTMRKAYSNYPATAPEGFEPFHASTVEPIFCEVPDGATVLDVGCNDGAMMQLLRDAKKCDVTGIDVSETALNLARQKGLKVFNMDAERMPFMNASFDVVILREVLVHIHEPIKALREIRRVLKPNGFLLGSTPHSNLERIVWDDKRFHHRYYDESTLKKDLSIAFKKIHFRVLNGAQFSVGFATSLMADKPAEILFKCGGKKTTEWEHDLLADKKTLRIWFGPTQPPGDVYYRMIGYAVKMRRMEGVEVGFENFNWNSNDGCSSWQEKIKNNGEGNPVSRLALDQLEKCLKLTDPWIFQPTYYEDILAFFECAKSVYPGKKFVTEIDDWIFDLPAYNVASYPYKPGSDKERIVHEQLELSDAVIVSTEFLKEKISKMFHGKQVHVIPNSIDFDVWDATKSDDKLEAKPEGVIRIGYTGCANHSGDMELIKTVLVELLNEFPSLEVIVSQKMGSFRSIDHPRFKVLDRWVNIVDYPAMLKGWDLDIGIAPLRDNAFNRAKSNLRWLEYSTLSLPTVASNVRPFAESIRNGNDGFLCTSKQEWYDTLKNLIVNEELRSKIGAEARRQVKSRFDMNDWAKKYAELLREIRDER